MITLSSRTSTEAIVVANSAASSPFAALVFDGLLTITDVESGSVRRSPRNHASSAAADAAAQNINIPHSKTIMYNRNHAIHDNTASPNNFLSNVHTPASVVSKAIIDRGKLAGINDVMSIRGTYCRECDLQQSIKS